MPMTIDEILSSDQMIEVAVEIDSISRSTYAAKTWLYSTHFREDSTTGTFYQYLRPGGILGPLSQSLSEDLLSGLANIQPGSLVLLQPPSIVDNLSQLLDHIFSGYSVRIKLGLTSFTLYSDFQLYRTLTIAVEPAVETTPDGIQATFQLASAIDRLLNEQVFNKRHLGIPNCVTYLTQSGRASALHIASYAITSYTLMGWFKSSAAQSGSQILTKHGSGTNKSWAVFIGGSSGGLGGKLCYGASFAAIDTTMIVSSSNYANGKWHSWVAAILDKSTAYLMVDDQVVGTYTPTVSVDTQSAVVELGALSQTLIGSWLQTAIFNYYIPPEEARVISSSRLSGLENGCIALWRGDDNAGTAINDYSSNNNDATISGTINVDWKWDFSDLGDSELSGRPYPINIGEIYNARAVLIDNVLERYRANQDATHWYSSTSNTTLAVKSRGTVLTPTVDYTAPSNGGDGVFSTVSQEDEPVTFDLTNNGSSIDDFFVSEVVFYFIRDRTSLSDSQVDNDQILRLNALGPWKCGYRTEADVTVKGVLSYLLDSSGFSYYESPDGKIFVDFLWPSIGYGPYGEPCLDLRGEEASSLNYGNIAQISNNCTVACWFNTRLVSDGSIGINSVVNLISKPSSGAVEYSLNIPLSGDIGRFIFRIGSIDTSSPSGIVWPDKWYFAAAVFDNTANTVKLYLAEKGTTLKEVASATNTAAPVTQTNSLRIGGESGEPWVSIQHPQIWNTTKTLAQLQSLMATPPIGNESGLIFYDPINKGSGTSTSDLVTGTVATIQEPARWSPYLSVDLLDTPSVKLSEFHFVSPAYCVVVKWGKNHAPMADSDLDTGLTQAAKMALRKNWQGEETVSDLTIKDRFPNARKIVLESSLTTKIGAQKLARAVFNRFSVQSAIGKLSFPPGLSISARACGLRIGDEIGISSPIPSQLSSRRSFRVIAVSPNPLQLSTIVVFWGKVE